MKNHENPLKIMVISINLLTWFWWISTKYLKDSQNIVFMRSDTTETCLVTIGTTGSVSRCVVAISDRFALK